MPEADQPEPHVPHPSTTVVRRDASFIAPDEQAPALALPPRHLSVREIFVAADGLRAGWGLLVYAALLYALLSGSGFLIHALREHVAASRSIAVEQARPLSSKSSVPAPSPLLPPGAILLGEGSASLSVVVATWLMGKIERRPTSVYGLGGRRRLRNFLAGFAWGLVLLSLLVFTLRASGLLAFDGRLLFGAGALRYGAIWLAGFLLVGLFEEYFFRGYLQFTLARGIDGIYSWLGTRYSSTQDARRINTSSIGFWIAALLLSFGFGFMHRSNAGESHVGLLAAALIAVVFCLSLWRTGSLWWAIGFHAAWDWAQSFLFGVADSGIAIQGHLFATHPAGRPLFSGGLTGPEGSVFILPVVASIAAVILLTLPSAHRERPLATPRATPLD